jgi:hypothetical protein
MPQGDKSSYTGKQKREASHIEKSYEKKGVKCENRESPRLGDGEQAGRRRQKQKNRWFLQGKIT